MVGKKVRSIFNVSLILCGIILFGGIGSAKAETDDAVQKEIQQLKQMVQQLAVEVHTLKSEKAQAQPVAAEYQQQLNELRCEVTKLNESPLRDIEETLGKLDIGGYGEIHANFSEGSDSDKMDLHRLVMYLGYEFSDWIKFNSEFELEHAFTGKDAAGDDTGYLLVEQAYVDFTFSDYFNVRAGRLLTPVGIINQKHEPTLFNGVERPNFSKYIIPSTWSSDGLGLFGNLTSELSYQAYVTGGLDGSAFSSKGIRGGRIKSEQSLNDPVFTGRVDFRPFEQLLADRDQSLRLGLSGYYGGLNNINGGGGNGVNANIEMTSADFEYSVSDFDFRGVVAHTSVSNAAKLGSGDDLGKVAEEMFGWYLEAAYHFMPDEWKVGKLKDADATVFVRYEEYDTQYKMPSGVAKDKSKDIEEVTFGINFYPVPNFVIKADYQLVENASGEDKDDRFNIGLGWAF